MRILFICGSLEPGYDGVGDYTRRLAGELIRHGHQASAVAINDKHLTKEFAGTEITDEINWSILRLPSIRSSEYRFLHAKEWIDQFDPKWLSLQFVPFSLHPKGLPFGLSGQLKSLGAGKRWHIMFHELWLGMDKESPLKNRLWGFFQKNIISSLLHYLNPLLITTNTHIYQYQLTRLGFKASFLPLFSNIRLRDNYELKKAFHDFETINFVIFGNIHFGAPINKFVKQAAAYSKSNKVISLMFIGNCGIEKQTWIKAWEANNLPYKDYGRQTEGGISQVLSGADFGITTTPYWLTEKSGAVAAMRCHGLPVICVAREWHTTGELNLIHPSNVFLFNKINFGDLIYLKKDSQTKGDVIYTTDCFLKLLSQSARQ